MKGFEEISDNLEIPNYINDAEKPLNSNLIRKKRVDINVLKSKLQENENKEFKKNIVIFSLSLTAIGILGIFLSI